MAQSSNQSLSPAPITTPLLGAGGVPSQQWVLWLQQLRTRVGGSTTNPLDTANANLATLQAAVMAVQSSVAAVQTDVGDIQGQQTADEARISALESTVGAQSGTWVPVFTGATVSGTVGYTGFWKSIGDELFWEVLVDASGGSVAFSAATLSNMPVRASRPGTFDAVNLTAYADYGNGFVQDSMAALPDFTLTAQVGLLSGRYVR